MADNCTILIADDHPLFRGALYQAVHMAVDNATLLEADSIDSLLSLLEQKAKQISLLLLDLKMPGANGFSALAHLRGSYPDLPIVVISALDDDAIIQQIHQQGARGFISKSTPLKNLVEAIALALEGEAIFPEFDKNQLSSDQSKVEIAERLATLTPQQYKVIVALGEGKLNKQIAYELGVSEATVKAHMTAIFRKLGVKNRTQAVISLQGLELVEP